MSEKPILFSGAMVRAILDGRKTMTRRVVKPQPTYICHDWQVAAEPGDEVIYRGWPHKLTESRGRDKAAAGELTPIRRRSPYGQPGDRLWVRETWFKNMADEILYRADYGPESYEGGAKGWTPSIHMPRWASRLTLEIVGVKVERLQDISEEDARGEGVIATEAGDGYPFAMPARMNFVDLWDEINAKRGYGWAKDPWVWVVEFKKVER